MVAVSFMRLLDLLSEPGLNTLLVERISDHFFQTGLKSLHSKHSNHFLAELEDFEALEDLRSILLTVNVV